MKNAFDGLDSKLDTAEDRISEFILAAMTGVHIGYSEVIDERVFNSTWGRVMEAL